MARHPDGPERVDRLDGSALAKRRARVVLEVISGRRTVLDACAELSVSETRFEDLRKACLEGAIAALEPRKIGRPRKIETEADRRVRLLQAEIEELRKALLIAEVREELAVGLPRARRRGKKARARRER